MSIASVLNNAADLLEAQGWCQGYTYHAATGQRCVLGAIYHINQGETDPEQLEKDWGGRPLMPASDEIKAEDYFRDWLQLHRGTSLLANWNDHVNRGASEVIFALRKAARDSE